MTPYIETMKNGCLDQNLKNDIGYWNFLDIIFMRMGVSKFNCLWAIIGTLSNLEDLTCKSHKICHSAHFKSIKKAKFFAQKIKNLGYGDVAVSAVKKKLVRVKFSHRDTPGIGVLAEHLIQIEVLAMAQGGFHDEWKTRIKSDDIATKSHALHYVNGSAVEFADGFGISINTSTELNNSIAGGITPPVATI